MIIGTFFLTRWVFLGIYPLLRGRFGVVCGVLIGAATEFYIGDYAASRR